MGTLADVSQVDALFAQWTAVAVESEGNSSDEELMRLTDAQAAAEIAVAKQAGTSRRAIELCLWFLLANQRTKNVDVRAVTRGDMQHFLALPDGDLAWEDHVILTALESMRSAADTRATASATFQAALRDADAADAACIAFNEKDREAYNRFHAAVDALPHSTVSIRPNLCEPFRQISTACSDQIEAAAKVAASVTHYADGRRRPARESDSHKQSKWFAGHRKIVAAYKWRQRAITRLGRLERRAEAMAESDRLSDAYTAAVTRAYETPVHTAGDLQAKVAFMIKTDAFPHSPEIGEIIAADVGRIAASER